jgi:O-antigen ligase
LRHRLALRWKQGLLVAVVAAGLLAFGWRFHGYFAAGATSVGARFDYWRAARQTALANPFLGTGPGTFQRPYARLKSPDAEMARLVHNDYLEQFSDSGFVGGLAYLVWIGAWLWITGRRVWRATEGPWFWVFLGTAAWLAQGVSEFSLYVPALAWTAFTLGGALAGFTARETVPSATPAPSSQSPK